MSDENSVNQRHCVIYVEARKSVAHFDPVMEGDDLHVMSFIPIFHCFTQLVNFILRLPNVGWKPRQVAIGERPELFN